MLSKKYIVCFLILGVALVGCKKGGGRPAFTMPPASVVGFKALKQPIEEKISLIGSLEANEQVEIKSEIEGTIEAILFQEGQAVKKGDVLFHIDQKKLKAMLEQAQANLQLAEATAKRYEELVKTQAVSKQEYDQAAATLDSNRASVDIAREEFDDATIIAPFDGLMSQRLVSQGQYIAKGASLGSLIELNPIKASFYVPEAYFGEIKIGQKIMLKVVAYPDVDFTGEVYFIDPQINQETRTALVKAYVPNTDGKLRPGMFASLNLIIHIRLDAVVIPETALMINAIQTNVYFVDAEQMVHSRPVEVGIRFDGMVEIVKGLDAGEAVVVEGIQKIRDGAKVNMRFEEETAENKK